MKSENSHEKRTTTSLINFPSTFEKVFDTEDENLQLHTIHETYPFLKKQLRNGSFNDPSFFKHTTNCSESFLHPDPQLVIDSKLKHQKKGCFTESCNSNGSLKVHVLSHKHPLPQLVDFCKKI